MSRAGVSLDDMAAIRLDIERIAGERAARKLIGAGLAITLGLVAVLVAWATIAQLGAAVMATGVVMGNHQVVQHPDGGVVSEILVHEGDLVQKGQPLLRLDPVQARAALATYQSGVDTDNAVIARLEAEETGAASVKFPDSLTSRAADPVVAQLMRTEAAVFHARRVELMGAGAPGGDQAAQSINMARGLQGQLTALNQQERLLQSQLANIRQLAAKGFAPQSRVAALEQTAASIEGQRQQYESQIAAYRNAAAAARDQSQELRNGRQAQVSTALADRRANLAAQLERLGAAKEVLERTEIRAPTDGHVIGLSVHTVGGVVGRGERLLEIVPVGEAPVIEARLAPIQGEHVKAGMKAELKLLGDGARNQPRLTGVVTRRSSDLLIDPKSGQPYYAIEVAVDRASIARVGSLKLMPGTPIEVILPTKSRSAMAYMLEPIAQRFAHGLKE
jgi:HlyD family type I secretion membrane fusion protein